MISSPLAMFSNPEETPLNFRALDVSDGEYMKTSFDHGLHTNPVQSVFRMWELDQAHTDQNSPWMDPEEAQKLYGLDGRLKFDTRIRESAAKFMHQNKIREIERQDVLSRGGGALRTTESFVAGLGASFLDPLNLAASFIPITAGTRYGKIANGLAMSFPRAAVSAFRARVVTGAAEGLVGSVIAEPFVLGAAKFNQEDYGIGDSVMNMIFGTIMGSTLHAGLGAISDARVNWQNKITADTIMAMNEGAMADLLNDRPVTAPSKLLTMTDEQLHARASIDPEIQKQYGDVLASEEFPVGPVYHGSNKQIKEFDTMGKVASPHEGYDDIPGAYFTSDPELAYGYGKWSEKSGGEATVHEAFLNLKNPAKIESSQIDSIKTKEEAAAFRKTLEEQGHDGIIVMSKSADGKKDIPLEYVAFDSKQINIKKTLTKSMTKAEVELKKSKAQEAIKEKMAQLKQEELSKLQAEAQSHISDDPDAVPLYERESLEPESKDITDDIAKVDETTKELMEINKDLLDEKDLKLLKSLDEEAESLAGTKKGIAEAARCFVTNMLNFL